MSGVKEVRLALTCEGSTDERFLAGIIRRTAGRILSESPRPVDLAEVEIIPKKKGEGQVENILNAAKEAYGWDILIVHADTDGRTLEQARRESITPGFEAVENTTDPNLCKNLVAITPAYMIENWILADKQKLKENIGTEQDDRNLGLDYGAKLVENMASPKEKIEEAIRIAFTGHRRKRQLIELEDLYEPKGNEIDLTILERLPSYDRFRRDLKNKFQALNFLR